MKYIIAVLGLIVLISAMSYPMLLTYEDFRNDYLWTGLIIYPLTALTIWWIEGEKLKQQI